MYMIAKVVLLNHKTYVNYILISNVRNPCMNPYLKIRPK